VIRNTTQAGYSICDDPGKKEEKREKEKKRQVANLIKQGRGHPHSYGTCTCIKAIGDINAS
jgi:hypothetical protein